MMMIDISSLMIMMMPWQLWHSLGWGILLSAIVHRLLTITTSNDEYSSEIQLSSSHQEQPEQRNHHQDHVVPDLIQASDREWHSDDDDDDEEYSSDEDDEEEKAATIASEQENLVEEQQQQQQPQEQEDQVEEEDTNNNNNNNNNEHTTASLDLLSQLVEEDGGDDNTDLTPEQTLVVMQMIRMRYNLERFIGQELRKLPGYDRCRRKDLARDITLLKYKGSFNKDFIQSMHTLRNLSNKVVHYNSNASKNRNRQRCNGGQSLPSYEECTCAVQEYMGHKQMYRAQEQEQQ